VLLENISLGKTLEIYVDREGYRYRLVSKVEQSSVRRVCVTAIMAGGRAFLFKPEDDIRIVYRDEDQMWEWLHVKAGIGKLEGDPVHYFEIVNKGRSFNRRQAYRVNIDEDVVFEYFQVPGQPERLALVPLVEEEYEAIVDNTGKEIPRPRDFDSAHPDSDKSGKVLIEKRIRMVPMREAVHKKVKGHVRDVSETGLGIFSNDRLQIGDNFSLEIPSDYGPLMTRCTVVRTDDLESANRTYRYYYGCVYTESDRKLIKYIYDVQRKQIQKQREKKEFDASVRAQKEERKKERKKQN
jgi:hypothetical protein